MDCSTPGFPVHRQLPELAQTHVQRGSDAFPPSHSVLGTYRPGEFIIQCPIFLLFHTVHGLLKARMLEWFAIISLPSP